ncbi:MAG: flagellin [Pseudomonadota bacterium]|nr:flagellin [Pseudomonadota bacterium]
MALVVNTNIASLVAQNNLSANRSEMEKAMERLSSGLRVNNARDDAAGLAIATRMDSQIRGMTKAVQNANDAISLTQTASGAHKEIREMLQRMRELAVQSSNTTNNSTDRASLDAEVAQLVAEIDQIAVDTRFNNQAILDGSYAANIQTGAFLGQDLGFSIDSMKTADLGLVTTGSSTGVSTSTYISGRTNLVPSHSGLEAGDIKINGQNMAAVAAADEITDVVDNINANIEGVTASAFNEVVMRDVGTGQAVAGTILVGIQNVGTSGNADDVTTQTFLINQDSSNLEELAALIVTESEGRIAASVNSDGKLVLSNDTGAAILVKDTSTSATATGLGSAVNHDETATGDANSVTPSVSTTTSNDARVFHGFIKLESDTGDRITIEKGLGVATGGIGTQANLSLLGFQQLNVMETELVGASNPTYTLVADAMTTAESTTALNAGDIKINGVDIYNEAIATDTFAGKLAAINAKTDETGVTASANFEYFMDFTNFASAAGQVTLSQNGATGTAATLSTASVAANVTNINTALDSQGADLTAEAIGNHIRIFSDTDTEVVSLSFTFNAAASGSGTTVAMFTDLSAGTGAQQVNSGLKFHTTGSSGIQIDTGENIASDFGLTETNVGAADFDSNATQMTSGSQISGISVSTVADANAAITSIDAAIQQVSDSEASLGAVENRLNHVIANVSETIVNTEASKSRIMDADFAVESARLAKQQILQQAASAMLAQANAAPQSVLSLLGG